MFSPVAALYRPSMAIPTRCKAAIFFQRARPVFGASIPVPFNPVNFRHPAWRTFIWCNMKTQLTPLQKEKAAARKRAWRKRNHDRKTAYERVMRNWKRMDKNDQGYLY